MERFRIKKFTYQGVEYQLSKPTSSKKILRPYTSLLIGPNGAGKSRLLRAITDVFNDMYTMVNGDISKGAFIKRENFVLEYMFSDREYIVSNQGKELLFLEEGQKVRIEDLPLPSNLICIAYNVSDKFPVTFYNSLSNRNSRYDNDFYSYLGIKVHMNSATPTGHVYRALDQVTSSIDNPYFQENMSTIFDFLDFDPVISLRYNIVKNRSFFGELLGPNDITVDSFKKMAVKLSESRSSYGYAYNTLTKLIHDNEDVLYQLVSFLNYAKHQRNHEVVFDFSSTNFIKKRDRDNYRYLDLARKLRIISYRDIIIRKKSGLEFSFRDSSSGEIQILTSMLSLACAIDHNSLILIDEPETSLHPNWQMKYFDLLYKTFNNFSGCHFIVASHSHFLVSDLRPQSSNIVSMIRNEYGQIESRSIPDSTFGWSAEQILLEVFNVPTTRNLFVADLVGGILNLISKPNKSQTHLNRIKKETEKLREYNLDKLDSADPMKSIIKKILKKYG